MDLLQTPLKREIIGPRNNLSFKTANIKGSEIKGFYSNQICLPDSKNAENVPPKRRKTTGKEELFLNLELVSSHAERDWL